MCGIIGFIGNEQAAPIVLHGLLKLEYRGYDSAGLASICNGELHIKKDKGRIEEIDKQYRLCELPGKVAIAHTRWPPMAASAKKMPTLILTAPNRYR